MNQYDYVIHDPDDINNNVTEDSPAPAISTPTTTPSPSSSSQVQNASSKVDTIDEVLLQKCFGNKKESRMAAIPPTAQVNPFCNPYDDNIYYMSENGLTEY